METKVDTSKQIQRLASHVKLLRSNHDKMKNKLEKAKKELSNIIRKEVECIRYHPTYKILLHKNEVLNEKYKELNDKHNKLLSDVEATRRDNAPLRETVNQLTAERSKHLKKIKRLENK